MSVPENQISSEESVTKYVIFSKESKEKLLNDHFILFEDKNKVAKHSLNWYVYRSPKIRKQVSELWNNGKYKGKFLTKKEMIEMENVSIDQQNHKKINVLFRNMENCGPIRNEFNNYRYDPQEDMFHCHISDGKNSFVVLWEADETHKVINIVRMGSHENFDYKRNKNHKKTEMLKEILKERNEDEKWKDYQLYLKKEKKGSAFK